jgi:indolepyruvate decarboxylase
MGDEPESISRRRLIQASAALAAAQGTLAAPGLGFAEAAPAPASMTVAKYILTRLSQQNVKILFGVPGATCDPVFAAASSAGLTIVLNSSDLEAGYAADGYARMRGLAAVAVTYGVGTMSLLPVIAGAYAERSPVVVINGGPSPDDLRIQKEFGTLFTHSIGREKADLAVFREVTEMAERVERVADAPRIVDQAIKTAITKQRPVYIEVAKNLWDANCAAPSGTLDTSVAPSGEETRLAGEIVAKLRAASRPALLLGIEVQRYDLADQVTALVNRLQLPWATTLLAKSVIPEQTPGFIGVYGGERAVPSVKTAIEGSDALLAVGCVMGRQFRRLVTQSFGTMTLVANQTVRIGRTPAAKATLKPLMAALQQQPWQPNPQWLARTRLPGLSFDERRTSVPPARPTPGASTDPGMTYDEALRTVSGFLDDTFLAITDTSLSMYPAAELNIAGRKGFMCNAVWQSIGYSVGAAVGVGLAQARRPLVVCGDGGFQMTAQSLSSLVKERVNAIVIVLDNGLHAIEQWILDKAYFRNPNASPERFLGLGAWQYGDLAKAMGVGFTRTATTADEFRQALADAKANTAGPSFIAAKIKPHDLPSGLATS